MTQEQKDRLAYQISVMQAALDDEEIEITDKYSKEEYWESTSDPLWNWAECDYRIKPEPSKPKYRSFELAEEVMEAIKEHGDWVKYGSYFDKIVSFSDDSVRTIIANIDYDMALKRYVFLDDTPFGKLIKE